jgi:hypothetical protein
VNIYRIIASTDRRPDRILHACTDNFIMPVLRYRNNLYTLSPRLLKKIRVILCVKKKRKGRKKEKRKEKKYTVTRTTIIKYVMHDLANSA